MERAWAIRVLMLLGKGTMGVCFIPLASNTPHATVRSYEHIGPTA